MPDLPTLYHLAVLVLLLAGLVTVLLNLACFDSLETAAPPGAGAPRVSILVPARNEERCIGPCIRSLLAQDYPDFELIVLDDQSSDGTPHMLDELGLRPDDPRRRVMRGQPLPPGWVGKNWACHQLAEAATGDFLFFTDADTTHAPGTVSAASAYAERRRASLVSAWPRLVTVSWAERLILPMILLLGLTLYPHWLVLLLQRWPRVAQSLPEAVRRALGAANGQFMFWRRSAYERVGGHALLRNHLVEDVALGRAVAARMDEGLRFFNCDALRFSTCRMYRSFGEVWEGFTKNIWPAFEGRLPAFLLVGLVQGCSYLAPWVFLFVKWGRPEQAVISLQIATILATRIVLTVRFRTSWLSCLLHPVAELFALTIGLNSWRLAGRRGVTWKGRRYTTTS
ncbi:MAG: chlorobactene glucosyltransferase [Chthoniobacter sp.]|jgi:chlorobactene glucosyltransferase|nr:chlorobactene glucosyltransferase [Chthoniobacter sp.]